MEIAVFRDFHQLAQSMLRDTRNWSSLQGKTFLVSGLAHHRKTRHRLRGAGFSCFGAEAKMQAAAIQIAAIQAAGATP